MKDKDKIESVMKDPKDDSVKVILLTMFISITIAIISITIGFFVEIK